MRQLRDASQQIQDDIKSAAFDEDEINGAPAKKNNKE